MSKAVKLHHTTSQPKIRSKSNRNNILIKNPATDDKLNKKNRFQKLLQHLFSIRLLQIQQYDHKKLLITANSNEIIGDKI